MLDNYDYKKTLLEYIPLINKDLLKYIVEKSRFQSYFVGK